ncbi:MAG: B12-binding domain-containing radical SAM protein [bacterium]
MAKLLIIQPQVFIYPSLFNLAGAVKHYGHDCYVLVTHDIETIEHSILNRTPDLIGFSAMTGIHKEIITMCKLIKKKFHHIPIIMGGIHPTLFPYVIYEDGIDIICRGEGEYPLVELLDRIEKKQDVSSIKNLWVKSENKVIKNELRGLVDPLDTLPLPDFSIYRHHPILSKSTYINIFLTRGCPYSCTYCHNSKKRELYNGKGKYIRSFSTGRIMKELSMLQKEFKYLNTISLGADVFGADYNFFKEIVSSYSQKFSIPYTFLIRPELIDEKRVEILSKTNCHMIGFGIESGSERVRRELLHRNYSNKKIIYIGHLLHRHKIKFRTYNMVGFPTETIDEMMSTVRINQQIKTDFPWCSIYTPYPKTELAQYCLDNNFLPDHFSFDDVNSSFHSTSILKRIHRNEVQNIHSLFQTMVKFPHAHYLLNPLIKRPYHKISRLWFYCMYGYINLQSENRTLLSLWRLAQDNIRFLN